MKNIWSILFLMLIILSACNSIYTSNKFYYYPNYQGCNCLSLRKDNTFEYYYLYGGIMRGYTDGVFVETKDSIFLYTTIEYDYFRNLILSLNPDEQKSQLSYWDSQIIFYKHRLLKNDNKSLSSLDSIHFFGELTLKQNKTAKKVCSEIFSPANY